MTVQHVMVDIETLGLRPGSVVMSAAFVRFSDLASTKVNLSIEEQHARGLQIDPETWSWWQQQSPAAWQASTENAVPVNAALDYFASWLAWAAAGGEFMIWCHGATFDVPMLDELHRRFDRSSPWPYWAARDTRTLYDLAGVDPRDYTRGVAHSALDDAMQQTAAAIDALRILAERRIAV